jgi:transcription elongation GreA/GreB family factor
MMPNITPKLKNELYQHCWQYIETRINTIQQAISEAQTAANEETKSSAGDKYETGRAMAQIDKDLNTKQLAEAQKIKNDLLKVDISSQTNFVHLGNVVKTNQGNYFIAISAGKIVIDNTTYFAVSPVSPIGSQLLKLKVNDKIIFNNKPLIINEIG